MAKTRKRSNKRIQAVKRPVKRSLKKNVKRTEKHVKKTKRKSTRRKLNEFMRLTLDAKKHDLQHFMYNGKKYCKRHKGHLVYYKKC